MNKMKQFCLPRLNRYKHIHYAFILRPFVFAIFLLRALMKLCTCSQIVKREGRIFKGKRRNRLVGTL